MTSCVRFVVPFRFSCCMRVEFTLLFPILLVRNELEFKGVASIVSGYTLTESL